MLDCGLRRGETVAIGANDIKDGLLRISRAVEYKTNSNQATIKEPKSESGVRFVPIPAELVAQLNTKTRYFFLQKDGTYADPDQPAPHVEQLPPRLRSRCWR